MELKEFIDLAITEDVIRFIHSTFNKELINSIFDNEKRCNFDKVTEEVKEYLLEKLTKKDES